MGVLDLVEAPPAEELAELLEEQVFGIRDYFIRNAVVPELYHSRIRRLHRLKEAGEALGHRYDDAAAKVYENLSNHALLTDLLRDFERTMALLRQAISSTLHPVEIGALAGRMVDVQLTYEEAFYTLTQGMSFSETEVRATDHADTGRLLHLLSTNDGVSSSEQATSELKMLLSRERLRINARRVRSGHV